MITPIKSKKKKGILWRRAIYLCKRCHMYTIRGEAKLSTNNTSVEIITKQEANFLIEKKRAFVERMKEKNGRTV